MSPEGITSLINNAVYVLVGAVPAIITSLLTLRRTHKYAKELKGIDHVNSIKIANHTRKIELYIAITEMIVQYETPSCYSPDPDNETFQGFYLPLLSKGARDVRTFELENRSRMLLFASDRVREQLETFAKFLNDLERQNAGQIEACIENGLSENDEDNANTIESKRKNLLQALREEMSP